MSSEKSEKQKLRAYYLKRREDMLPNEADLKSKRIINTLIKSDLYQYVTTVHCYVSIEDKNEVRTKRLLEQMFDDGKRVVVPKILNKGRLAHSEISSLGELKINRWGVGEPVNDRYVDTDELELIIVPMVAGDRFRNRLGYGKGFYDRFLRKVQAKKVGLLYDLQVHPSPLMMETHDIPLDLLITENEQI